MKAHRIVGISFDHMHMGDLLRLAMNHADAEVVGVWHDEPEKPREVLGRLGLPDSLIHADWRSCMESTAPTAVILCAATARHAEWTCKLAEYGVDLLVEKPFAASMADAERMIEATERNGCRLAINWPLAWYPCHRTTKRLIDEGAIGQVLNIHFYDGNRGPAHHVMDKIEVTGEALLQEKQRSWFYRKDQGGGSLLDYLGYGTTLATWFNGGAVPLEVTSLMDAPDGVDVDEHSVTVARYACGLSKFETRWGTFSDPWIQQPQPKCGFVVCGTEGTISSYDFEPTVRLQSALHPAGIDLAVDPLVAPHCDPITYFLDCQRRRSNVEGPLSPVTSLIGQRIVDAAFRSAVEKRVIRL